MIPTRAFQKIRNTRVIGFDTKLAAFGVLRDHSLDLIPFRTHNKRQPKISPKFVKVDSTQLNKWNNPLTEFSIKYRSELLRYLVLSGTTEANRIIKQISLFTGDYLNSNYLCLYTGKSHTRLPRVKYLVNIDYRVIKFQEFV